MKIERTLEADRSVAGRAAVAGGRCAGGMRGTRQVVESETLIGGNEKCTITRKK